MENKYLIEYYSFKKVVSHNNKGFTLIELLAVIIILGVLMIIAIPSVTEYIQTSRKSSYVRIANQYISGARTEVNSGEVPMYDTNTTYYLPANCVSLEKGGDSPFGELEEAYIVVTYDGNNYDYYWTSRDSSNMGINLTHELLLDDNSIESGITSISTNIGVGEREKIFLINNCNVADVTEIEVTDAIENKGAVDGTVNNLFEAITESAYLDSISSTYVTASTGINFNVAPSNTNGKGLYIRSGTENNKYPIHYYRGSVANNNVIFAGFCWKIVRTTKTGGIKLIYNGEQDNGNCNSTGVASTIGESSFNMNFDDNAYVGYMYGTIDSNTYAETHSNKNDSTIKIKIDEWYKLNIEQKGYASKLEDTIWCNDRSFSSSNTGTGFAKSNTTYGVNGRLSSPSLECKNANDRFTVSTSNGNGALTYPIALLTSDEATLAGNGYNGYGKGYLFSGQPAWWTLSPNSFSGTNGYAFAVYTNQMGFGLQTSSFGVRPAISLKHWTKYTIGGDGTANNPYIIK